MSTKAYAATGYIEKGRLTVRNRKRFSAVLGSWKDGEVTITVEQAHAHRSLPQNAYYWGVVVELISEHTGYTPEETHEALKTMFLPKKLAMLKGNGDIAGELVIGGSTTALNKIEFGEYIERIREWAHTEIDVYIPRPEESGDLFPETRERVTNG